MKAINLLEKNSCLKNYKVCIIPSILNAGFDHEIEKLEKEN